MTFIRIARKLLNNKIIHASGWYTLSNFFVRGVTFITIPIFTRLLSTHDYGIVSVYNTWVAIFTIIIGLSLNESIRRAKYDFNNDYDSFISSIVFLSILIFGVYIIFFTVFNDIFTTFIGFNRLIYAFMIFQAYFSFVYELGITKMRYEYRYKTSSIIGVIYSIMGVVLSILMILYVFNNRPYLGKIVGNGIPIFVMGFFIMIALLKKGDKYVNIKYWKYALVLSTPLVLHSLSSLINSQFDRLLINKYLGESLTGIYSFSYNIAMIVAVITISLEQAWLPWFFEKFKNEEFALIRDKSKIYRDAYTVMYICVLMFSTELIKLMANQTYWKGLEIIPWIFMGYYFQFMYAFEVNVEYAMKKTKLIPLGTIVSALLNISLNIIFIPIYGYVAAAVTTVLSYFCLFLFHYLMTSKVIRFNVVGFKFHLKSIVYVVLGTIYFIIFKDNLIIRVIGVLLVFFTFYLKHKDLFKDAL